ncbi:MAG: hypothetical protein ABI378_10190 [Chitinophagaceae bacterium]
MKLSAVALPALLCLCCISCKPNNADKIVGAWQEVRVLNPQLDDALFKQNTFADTVGTSTDSLQNIEFYGATNIDSFKLRAKANLDSFRKYQFYSIRATIFDFQKGGKMYLHSLDGVDTAKWFIDDDGALILDQEHKGEGSKIRMEIAEISDTLLQLKYKEQYSESTAVFKPVKK